MSTYNNTNTISTISGWTSAQWRAFGDDFASDPKTALTSRWTLTTGTQNSMSVVLASNAASVQSDCYDIAAAIDANIHAIDFSGMDIVISGSATHPKIDEKWTLHIDCQWIGSAYVITSVWFSHKVS